MHMEDVVVAMGEQGAEPGHPPHVEPAADAEAVHANAMALKSGGELVVALEKVGRVDLELLMAMAAGGGDEEPLRAASPELFDRP
jgi:hypothetical protein